VLVTEAGIRQPLRIAKGTINRKWRQVPDFVELGRELAVVTLWARRSQYEYVRVNRRSVNPEILNCRQDISPVGGCWDLIETIKNDKPRVVRKPFL